MKRHELLALGGIATRMRIVIGGPNATERSGIEEAWCEWNGRRFLANSRHGATFALCRKLVAAGCPDMAMQVYRETDGIHQYTFKSIHRAAGRTIRESAAHVAREVAFVEPPQAAERVNARQGKGLQRQVPAPRYPEPSASSDRAPALTADER
jgi:hypothetical protein